MIMITSAAGVRLARAKAALDAAEQAMEVGDQAAHRDYSLRHYDFCQAARAVADEMLADRHHEREGD
jgi:hypothetical protein